MGGFHRQYFCLIYLALLCVFPSGELQAKGDAIYVALLVGSNHYQGTEGLAELEYADDDVLRFAQTIHPLVGADYLHLLIEPDEEVREGLSQLGVSEWQPPGVEALLSELSLVEQQILDLRSRYGGETEVRVVLFVSAHGDAFGVHLADGIMMGPQLQSALSTLSADSVLLVADACFSSNWLVLKGADPEAASPDFPLDAVADAVRDLERVGMVAAQSGTREERGLVRGGLLTHMVSSALVGAADLDQDGRILYPELETYLGRYAEQSDLLRRIQVQAPRKTVEKPPVLVELSQLGNSGLYFPRSERDGDERYWIRDSEGRLLVELAKRGSDSRRIYLPPGHYRIQHFGPPTAWYGREGDVDVTSGFVDVGTSLLTDWWLWTGGKGVSSAVGPLPETARSLSLAEASYHVMSPVKESISWKSMPSRDQVGLRFQFSGLRNTPVEDHDPHNSLAQEQPFQMMAVHWDRRVVSFGGGQFLTAGAELAIGRSPNNVVGVSEQAVVWRTDYRGRLGYYWERQDYGLRLGLDIGLSSAWTTAYRLAFMPSTRLTIAADRRIRHSNLRFVLGGGGSIDAEPHELGNGPEFVKSRSLFVFSGIAF